jgi:thiol:disulfide interchange protein
VTESQQSTTESTPPSDAPQKPLSVPFRPVVFLLVLFFGVFAVVSASKLFTPKERVPWRSDLPAAQAEAKSTGKPVLLYVTADWCGPCQWMKRHVFTAAAVADAVTPRYTPVRVDHDARMDIVVKYQLQGVPWFAVLDAEGNPTRVRDYAFETPEEMIAWLNG